MTTTVHHRQQRERVSFQEVKALAQADIFRVLGALGIRDRPRGNYICMRNPLRGEKHASLVIWTRGRAIGCFVDYGADLRGDLVDLVAYWRGHSAGGDRAGRGEALAFLADVLGLARMTDAEREARARALAERKRQAPSIDVDAEDAKRASKAKALWNEGEPIGGSTAEDYLRARCITIAPPQCLRFDPSLEYPLEGPNRGTRWPALLAEITRADGTICGVHRTFLRPDGKGKAPVRELHCGELFEKPKLALGPYAGGAVRLRMPAEGTWDCGIAEGIETALSAIQLYKLPVFAALSCSNLAAITFPRHIRRIIIFADRDAEGSPAHQAVLKARASYQQRGLTVEVKPPPAPAKDWNDELMRRSS